ncbi:metal dependent phosphohydrolase [Geotalea uraniireducens Rf4]|uniref:Metal dependent phosphohydrolase n=2 Tax=Geotalea uraniireducens TaxID=351604 RepID=A5GFC6_GEOUR|nr:metal dependent phosphohydrolase [Geotalea uraniireducens Rf4]
MSFERIGKMNTLMELATLINTSLDPKEIRTRAIEAGITLMDAEAGSLLLIDRVTNELYFEVALGEKGELLKEVRMTLGEGFAGWVARTGEPLIVDDVQNDPRFYRKADEKSRFVTRNLIAAPLRVKGKTLGVLEVMNKHNGAFTAEDMELFVSLANQVAPAVENAYLYEDLRETFFGTALALTEALEKRDSYTGGHTRRVRDYCMTIGVGMGLTKDEMDNLLLSAILHDIGKIGVRDSILGKEAPLSRDEAAVMGSHARIGADILRHVRTLKNVVPAVLSHHEKFDGSGYPARLRGDDIPLNARIISVADTFDAMTTDRPYRKALSKESAMAELRRCSGTQFDPTVVEAFVAASAAE